MERTADDRVQVDSRDSSGACHAYVRRSNICLAVSGLEVKKVGTVIAACDELVDVISEQEELEAEAESESEAEEGKLASEGDECGMRDEKEKVVG